MALRSKPPVSPRPLRSRSSISTRASHHTKGKNMNKDRRFQFMRLVAIPVIVAILATTVIGAMSATPTKALNNATVGLYQEPYFPHTTFDTWLGRPTPYALVFTPRSSWGDIDGSTQTTLLTDS